MSSPHMQHLISWDSLQQLLVADEDKGIELPIDSDGRIHITSRAVGIQVENRRFLQDRVCNDPSCAVVGTAIFYKRKKQQFSWKIRLRSDDDSKKLQRFHDSFVKAIQEIGASKLEKAKAAIAGMTPEQRTGRLTDELQQRARSSFRGTWEILYELVAHGDLETILILIEDKTLDVWELLSEHLGGQAVGVGFHFLVITHLLPFYFESNMIIASNLQAQDDKWHMRYSAEGNLLQGHNDFTRDCDGRTFLRHLRPTLSKGVFMCDLEKTRELLKQVFDAITTFYVVSNLHSFPETGNLEFDVIEALCNAFQSDYYCKKFYGQPVEFKRVIYIKDT